MKGYWWEPIAEFIAERILFPFMLVVAPIAFFIAIPCFFYSQYTASKSPTFELKKDEWTCSQERTYTTTSMHMVGKVMIPQTTTHTECVNWVRK